jgi:hypothetical protein
MLVCLLWARQPLKARSLRETADRTKRRSAPARPIPGSRVPKPESRVPDSHLLFSHKNGRMLRLEPWLAELPKRKAQLVSKFLFTLCFC